MTGALPLVVGHRGYSAIAPENTLAAFAAALRSGVAYLEIDARTTADGVPVVLHDATVDRTTDGTGEVAALTWPAVRRLDAGSWFCESFTGQRVPTLDEAIELFEPSAARLLLEIKPPSGPDQVGAIVDAVLDRGLADRVVVQSFDEGILRHCRRLAPAIPRALLRTRVDVDPVSVGRELGLAWYNPSARDLLQRADTVGRLRDSGIGVMPWTVDDAGRWRALIASGVAGIITNRPGDLRDWLDGTGVERPRCPTG